MARVVIDDVHVDFPIYGAQDLSLRRAIYQRATGGAIHRDAHNSRIVVKALSGISLQLQEGDRLGLIGHNGSGKSTLLKAIAGIYEPVQGRILVEGRVTPLFDMMPGLDPEDSGYENIFTSGMLLGMSREYLESMIPEIEEFCELGEYLSLPVRTYSAGMMTRLGFALVTALDPDVLLMDEGFGAADLRFAERSAERMDAFIGRSRIMVLASHSDSMIASICNKVAWLSEGKLVEVGPLDEVLEKYHENVHARTKPERVPVTSERVPVTSESVPVTPESDPIASEIVPESEAPESELPESELPDFEVFVMPEPPEPKPAYNEESIRDVGVSDRRRRTTVDVIFTKLIAFDSEGRRKLEYEQGQVVTFRIEYETLSAVPEISLLLRLYLDVADGNGVSPQIVADLSETISAERVEAGYKGWIEMAVPTENLMPIAYSLYAWIGYQNRKVCYDVIDTNVALPKLVIKPRSSGRQPGGALALSCSCRSSIVAPPESILTTSEK